KVRTLQQKAPASSRGRKQHGPQFRIDEMRLVEQKQLWEGRVHRRHIPHGEEDVGLHVAGEPRDIQIQVPKLPERAQSRPVDDTYRNIRGLKLLVSYPPGREHVKAP